MSTAVIRAEAARSGAAEEGWDLERLVSTLRTARNGHSERRDEARRSQRPSRDALVQIVKGLRAALFPSHFGVSDFTETSIDFFVGSTLDSREHRGAGAGLLLNAPNAAPVSTRLPLPVSLFLGSFSSGRSGWGGRRRVPRFVLTLPSPKAEETT